MIHSLSMDSNRRSRFRVLTQQDEIERLSLMRERDENERRHTEIVLRLAKLEQRRLGQAYRFQDDGWPR